MSVALTPVDLRLVARPRPPRARHRPAWVGWSRMTVLLACVIASVGGAVVSAAVIARERAVAPLAGVSGTVHARIAAEPRELRSRPGSYGVSVEVREVDLAGPPEVVAPMTALDARVDRLREGLRRQVADLPPFARGLVPGVAIGEDRALPDRIAEAMRTTSLTHLTAVSGNKKSSNLAKCANVLHPVRGVIHTHLSW
ncbi:hypothetical protein [Pseudactinotalea sp. HY158]|uniref:hypothetical protein n=1 Tax=Pseudactinotalea sp. HY158 TaxID=2654547 RepID=UPI00129C3905|nr:hypothetical protein [Pseudactinotalea sp. HY158]QGH69580.1 hypothetical protein GCE65_08675 [Pseudactinotalea sp. HY158]